MAVAKKGNVKATKQAQTNLMNWLEDIFTKTRVENFEANNKNPLRDISTLSGHSSSFIPLVEESKTLKQLTQLLVREDFYQEGEKYLDYTKPTRDIALLANYVMPALKNALVAEHHYTLDQEGMLVKRTTESSKQLSKLVNTINSFAQALIPITPEAIEVGRVPLKVFSGEGARTVAIKMWDDRFT